MKDARLILLAAVALLVVAAACGAGSDEEPVFPAADIELGAGDHGIFVKLNKGQSFKISLKADPSEGFGWGPSSIDEGILRQAGTHYGTRSTGWAFFRRSTTIQTLLFEAIDVGQTALTLVYGRQGEEDTEFSDRFSVRLTIR